MGSLYDDSWKEMPCEDWEGKRTENGYGFIPGHPITYVHVLTYVECFGPIKAPHDRVLHKCDNRPCRQPLHLFSGTHADNMKDAAEKGRVRNQNSDRTRCDRGHPYLDGTFQVNDRGHRVCRLCTRENMADSRRRRGIPTRSEFEANRKPMEFCANGHKMEGWNILDRGSGRECRTCTNERQARRKRELRALRGG